MSQKKHFLISYSRKANEITRMKLSRMSFETFCKKVRLKGENPKAILDKFNKTNACCHAESFNKKNFFEVTSWWRKTILITIFNEKKTDLHAILLPNFGK